MLTSMCVCLCICWYDYAFLVDVKSNFSVIIIIQECWYFKVNWKIVMTKHLYQE